MLLNFKFLNMKPAILNFVSNRGVKMDHSYYYNPFDSLNVFVLDGKENPCVDYCSNNFHHTVRHSKKKVDRYYEEVMNGMITEVGREH